MLLKSWKMQKNPAKIRCYNTTSPFSGFAHSIPGPDQKNVKAFRLEPRIRRMEAARKIIEIYLEFLEHRKKNPGIL